MPISFNATVSLIENNHYKGVTRDTLEVDMDSRPGGETQAGPTPMELVLNALAGCTAMDVVAILRKRKRAPEQFEIFIEGTKRDEHPKHYTHVNLTYRAKGEGITIQELERAAELSMTRYCAVSAMVKTVAEVKWTCELIE